jgi:hypothetical protein
MHSASSGPYVDVAQVAKPQSAPAITRFGAELADIAFDALGYEFRVFFGRKVGRIKMRPLVAGIGSLEGDRSVPSRRPPH